MQHPDRPRSLCVPGPWRGRVSGACVTFHLRSVWSSTEASLASSHVVLLREEQVACQIWEARLHTHGPMTGRQETMQSPCPGHASLGATPTLSPAVHVLPCLGVCVFAFSIQGKHRIHSPYQFSKIPNAPSTFGEFSYHPFLVSVGSLWETCADVGSLLGVCVES